MIVSVLSFHLLHGSISSAGTPSQALGKLNPKKLVFPYSTLSMAARLRDERYALEKLLDGKDSGQIYQSVTF